jgi:LPXTG-motif cell wall-anchored protein
VWLGEEGKTMSTQMLGYIMLIFSLFALALFIMRRRRRRTKG